MKSYIQFINESVREEELNRILDKISDKGVESLTQSEKETLSEFDGTFDRSPQDTVEIDKEGDIRVNDKRYNPYNIPSEFYDEDIKDRFKGVTKLTNELKELVVDYINDNFEKKKIPGAHKKQIVGKQSGRLHRISDLIDNIAYDLEIEPKLISSLVKDWYETDYWNKK